MTNHFFYPWIYYDMAEGEGDEGGDDTSGEDPISGSGDKYIASPYVQIEEIEFEEQTGQVPEPKVVINVDNIAGIKHISSFDILSTDKSSLIRRVLDKQDIEIPIPSKGLSCSAKVVGNPGARFHLNIKDIDDNEVLSIYNEQISASGEYLFSIYLPGSSTVNKYKININPGDGSRLGTFFPKTDPMWVIHQAPDPTVTFTKETGTISGATYSGSDKTITAEPGADIGLATGVLYQSNRITSQPIKASITSPLRKVFGQFDHVVTAAKSATKIYISTVGLGKKPKYINSTIKKKLVKNDAINTDIITLNDVENLNVNMECKLDSYTKTNFNANGTILRLSDTQNLTPGMRVVGRGLASAEYSNIIRIVSVNSEEEITISKELKIESREQVEFFHFFNTIKIKLIDTVLKQVTLDSPVNIKAGTFLSFKNNEMSSFPINTTGSNSGSASATLTNAITINKFPSEDITFTLNTDEIFTLTPNAWNQYVQTTKETALDINVLLYDTDENVASKTPSTVRNPIHGIISGSYGAGDGTITYTPNPKYVCEDNFTFKVNDGTTDSKTRTVYITITR